MLLVLSLGPCVQPRLCKGISTELHFWILGEPCATESLDKAQQYPGGIAETAWASQMFPDFILICHESCSHDMGMFDEVAKLAFEILNVLAGSQTHHSKSRSKPTLPAKGYMTDGDKAEEAALLQEHGKQTFAKYMKVLMEGPEVFRMVAKCHESDMKENLLICCSQRHFIHLTIWYVVCFTSLLKTEPYCSFIKSMPIRQSFSQNSNRFWQESLTPLGHKMAWDADTASTRKRLTVAVAGSTCTDHSNIGH